MILQERSINLEYLKDCETYEELLQGYIIRYQESKCCIGTICSDIDYTKIYDKLMTWINKHWSKSKKKRQQ